MLDLPSNQLGQLLTEYMVISVTPDSPLRSATDILARLMSAPDALSAAIGTALGNTTPMSIGIPLKRAGVDVVVSNRRFITAPAGLTAAQIAWWDALFARTVKSPEWKKILDEQYWINDYVPSGAARKYLDQENASALEILTDLGLAKQ